MNGSSERKIFNIANKINKTRVNRELIDKIRTETRDVPSRVRNLVVLVRRGRSMKQVPVFNKPGCKRNFIHCVELQR